MMRRFVFAVLGDFAAYLRVGTRRRNFGIHDAWRGQFHVGKRYEYDDVSVQHQGRLSQVMEHYAARRELICLFSIKLG